MTKNYHGSPLTSTDSLAFYFLRQPFIHQQHMKIAALFAQRQFVFVAITQNQCRIDTTIGIPNAAIRLRNSEVFRRFRKALRNCMLRLTIRRER